MKDYVVKELIANNEKKHFPQEPFNCFDPYTEYFLLVKERKGVYLVRKINDKIHIIDLKFATPEGYIIEENEFFNTYIGKPNFMLIQIPTYTGGADQASKYDKQIKKARKDFFKWLLSEGYFD